MADEKKAKEGKAKAKAAKEAKAPVKEASAGGGEGYEPRLQKFYRDVVVCTTARTDEEARALLNALNFPFRQ
jgi:hypothetical protein